MKKIVALIGAMALGLTALVGCGEANNQTGLVGTEFEVEQITPIRDYKVAMVAAGVFGDQGMNDALLNGMVKFTEATGIEVNSVEIFEFADHEINARNFASQGYDLIVMGGPVSEIMPEIAEAYPDTHFILNKGTIDDMDNVTSIQFDEAQPSFLGGVYSVLMSEYLNGNKQAGWVGGMRIPDLEKARIAFQAGAEYVDGNVDVIYVGDFTDIAKAQEITKQMYVNGAGIVQAYAGGASTGVYQAADDGTENQYAMGCATGQFEQSDKIIASVIVKYDEALYGLMTNYVQTDEIESGIQVLNIETDGSALKYADTLSDTIPEEIKETIRELEEKIISGEIEVPTTEDEYNTFNK